MKYKIKIITHFHKDDIECCYDYAFKEVFINNEKIFELEDEYHSDGTAKIKGFIEGFKFAKKLKDEDITIIMENIADFDWDNKK